MLRAHLGNLAENFPRRNSHKVTITPAETPQVRPRPVPQPPPGPARRPPLSTTRPEPPHPLRPSKRAHGTVDRQTQFPVAMKKDDSMWKDDRLHVTRLLHGER